MLKSLGAAETDLRLEADVAVVGAGLAGLFLADKLAAGGLRVLVLESGQATQVEERHPLNTVEVLDQPYAGAELGRFRCLGGTSTRWGGALLPYLSTDLQPHGLGWHDGWGIDAAELSAYVPEAERHFGVEAGSYEDGLGEGPLPGFLERRPKWPRFGKRSTAALFRNRIETGSALDVWLDATVTHLTCDTGSVRGVIATSTTGRQLDVRAPYVVLAAGALETTRLLLLFDRAQNASVFAAGAPLGVGFHDHLSAPVADLQAMDRTALIRAFAFAFVPGGMRNTRFELTAKARHEHNLPAAFAHIAFTRGEGSGFESLRKLFQAVQTRRRPALADVAALLRDAPWFARAVWWRIFERRVLPPSDAAFELHLVTEQAPSHQNRIGLSGTQTDRFGQPLASVSWAVRDSDKAAFWRVAQIAASAWTDGPLAKVAPLSLRPKAQVMADLHAGGGIYHPAGTTRIGPCAATGVVDAQLGVYGVRGLHALATSVFPTVGGSSPSLALVLLALRLGDHLLHSAQRPAST